MYEARQNKKKVSRRINSGCGSGMKQRVQIVNDFKKAIQRDYLKKETVYGSELYMIEKQNLNTGTETTTDTREYVNSSSVTKPDEIRFDYEFDDSSAEEAANKVKRSDDYFWVNNPKPDKSYPSGNYWDAGHKLAKINGGFGDRNDEVFPQAPFINQGNSRLMNDHEDVYSLWKGHEKKFYDGVEEYGFGSWWIKFV